MQGALDAASEGDRGAAPDEAADEWGTPDAAPRFLVDHMLEKLGRYLRCLGYDAEWDRGATTAELVRRANAEGRILLTRNRRRAHQHPLPEHVHYLAEADPVAQLHELLALEGLDPLERLFTRCVRCNVALDELAPDDPRLARLPPRVRARYRAFTSCPRCGTLFWRGGHVTNTCRKLGLPDGAERG